MDKQVQRAGNNAQQIQATTVIMNNGIDEKRTREIFSEMFAIEKENYTKEAFLIAENRVDIFQETLIPRIEAIEGAAEAFADPKFQFLLRDAQKSAAKTERKSDYELLTELLVCHIQKGTDRKNRAGIDRAISIVDEIDNDALCGLTLMHSIDKFRPISPEISEGLGVLNELYSRIIYVDLPSGKDWLEHLDLLGAIRLSSIGSMKKLLVYMSEVLNGYTCVGIAKDSDEYKKSIEILKSINLDEKVLINHELIEGYVRIPVVNKRDIDKLNIVHNGSLRKIMVHESDGLKKILDLYSNDSNILNQVRQNFEKKWDLYPFLKMSRMWWDEINSSVEITHIGTVLAHTNAKRCDTSLPDLI